MAKSEFVFGACLDQPVTKAFELPVSGLAFARVVSSRGSRGGCHAKRDKGSPLSPEAASGVDTAASKASKYHCAGVALSGEVVCGRDGVISLQVGARA